MFDEKDGFVWLLINVSDWSYGIFVFLVYKDCFQIFDEALDTYYFTRMSPAMISPTHWIWIVPFSFSIRNDNRICWFIWSRCYFKWSVSRYTLYTLLSVFFLIKCICIKVCINYIHHYQKIKKKSQIHSAFKILNICKCIKPHHCTTNLK